MNMKKGESRQELLNRAFIYVLFIGIAVIIFLRVKPLIFDIFVALVLAALAEPVVYRLSKKFGRNVSALISVGILLLVIFGIIFSLIPVMVQEIYYLSTQLPTYLDNILDYIENINIELIDDNIIECHLRMGDLNYFQNEELKVKFKDYYFSNVIARSSKTMLDCNNSKLNIKSTGTDG